MTSEELQARDYMNDFLQWNGIIPPEEHTLLLRELLDPRTKLGDLYALWRAYEGDPGPEAEMIADELAEAVGTVIDSLRAASAAHQLLNDWLLPTAVTSGDAQPLH